MPEARSTPVEIEGFAPGAPGAFQVELQAALWRRCVQVTAIGLGISVLAMAVWSLLARRPPAPLEGPLAGGHALRWLHALSFGLVLPLLLGLRRRLGQRSLTLITFLLFTANLGVAIWAHGQRQPSGAPFFEISLLLFLPAALIPWSLAHQASLAAAAVIGFVVAQMLLIGRPLHATYWAGMGGRAGWHEFLVMSGTGIVALGAVSILASHTLYSLRQTVYRVRRLGSYVIKGEIGGGGMGRILLAEHAAIRRPTAVKILRAPGADPELLSRFEQEVQLSARLTHPNTIAIYDYGRAPGGIFYYAMEHLEGLDLQAFVRRFGPMPAGRTLHVLEQVCGSLAEAHQLAIVHRDVKPSNVFLTRRGGMCDFVKVLDFGLAVSAEQGRDAGAGSPAGTPLYAAPEMLSGRPADPRSDVYGVGAVAYFLLTGRPPLTGLERAQSVQTGAAVEPPAPSALAETPVPPDLDEILLKCLRENPEERFPDAGVLGHALAAVARPEPWDFERAATWWALHGLPDAPAAPPAAALPGSAAQAPA